MADDWRGGFSWLEQDLARLRAIWPGTPPSSFLTYFFLVGNPALNWFLYLLHNWCSEEMVIRELGYKLNINNWTEEEVEECTDDILLESQCYGQTVTTLKLVLIFFSRVFTAFWPTLPTHVTPRGVLSYSAVPWDN